MVYLPTFTIKINQMLVNIPYMDPMGYKPLFAIGILGRVPHPKWYRKLMTWIVYFVPWDSSPLNSPLFGEYFLSFFPTTVSKSQI